MKTGGKKVKVKVKEKRRYDSDLTPEELEQAIALFKAQRESGENADEEETKLDAEDVINGVRQRKDRRDSDEEMDAEEIIAEQEGDIEALLEVIDELQAASDMTASDEDDTQEDEDDTEGTADEDDTQEDEDDTEENADEDDEEKSESVNMDSVDKLFKRNLRDYLDVCRVAERLNLDGVENMDLIEARKRIIKTVSPKLKLDGKSKSYINAAYDIAKQNVSTRKTVNAQRKRMVGTSNYDSADSVGESSAAKARERMIAKREKNGGND